MAQTQRQIAIVIDLNKCLGCQTCTVACKMAWTNDKGMDHHWWCKVNTMPGRGYPKDWEKMGGGHDANGNVVLGKEPTMEDYGGVMEFNFNQVFRGGTAQQVHLAPVQKVTWGPNWDEDMGGGEFPNAYFFYLPRLCNHCWQPSCAKACPQGAIQKRPEDGIVWIQSEKCEGCTDAVCAKACPYKEIFQNTVTGFAEKCNGCTQRVDAGIAPACVRTCPGRCMWIDYIDNEAGPVHKLVRQWQVALPLHPEFNTGPNVYYVPPLAPHPLDENGNIDESRTRIPLSYLESLFGPNVGPALETLKAEMAKRRREPKERSELMELLIAVRWQEVLGSFPKDPAEEVKV